MVGVATAKLREPKHVRTRGTCLFADIICFDRILLLKRLKVMIEVPVSNVAAHRS